MTDEEKQELVDRAFTVLLEAVQQARRGFAFKNLFLAYYDKTSNFSDNSRLALYVRGYVVFTAHGFDRDSIHWTNDPESAAHALALLREHMVLEDLSQI